MTAMPAACAGPTTLSTWARAIRRTLEARGLDARALFAAAGMDWNLLDEPTARYPLAQSTRLWALAVEATGDAGLGLAVASHVGATTFHALGYAVMASANLRDMLTRVVRYFRIVTDVSALELQADADSCTLIVHTPAQPQPAPEAVDAFISLLVRTARSLAGRELVPLAISLRRPAPPGDAHARVLRAPIRFGASHDAVRFARADCERPLDTANRDLAQHNDAIAQRFLDQLQSESGSLRPRVRTAVLAQLQHGEPVAERIAAQLLMSLRSLQRKLADEGTSFEALLDELRRGLAQDYLRDPRYAVGEIAFLLGYHDASSFTRAFRRWHGMAPSRWRSSAAAESLRD